MISIRRLVTARQPKVHPEAFQFRDELYRYIFVRVGHVEEAEDLTMDVIHACQSTDAENLKAYMIGVARHQIADHFRRFARAKKQPENERTYDLSTSDDFLRTQAVLARLAENYREHLVLKYVCGFSSEEVAVMVESTSTAVDNTLQRARKAFADEWNLLHGDEYE